MTIPQDKPFYVTSKDKAMSGWGMAKGLSNICIVPCDSLEEAEGVFQYVRSRPEQTYISIRNKYPYYNPKRYLVSNLTSWKEQAKKKGFLKEKTKDANSY